MKEAESQKRRIADARTPPLTPSHFTNSAATFLCCSYGSICPKLVVV
jgi:hypothetical protein